MGIVFQVEMRTDEEENILSVFIRSAEENREKAKQYMFAFMFEVAELAEECNGELLEEVKFPQLALGFNIAMLMQMQFVNKEDMEEFGEAFEYIFTS